MNSLSNTPYAGIREREREREREISYFSVLSFYVAMCLSALFLLLCGYFGTTKLVAVVLLTFGVGLGGLGMAGFAVNHIDIAPHFAGVLMGISNTAGTIPGILGPQIAKMLTPNVRRQIGNTDLPFFFH